MIRLVSACAGAVAMVLLLASGSTANAGSGSDFRMKTYYGDQAALYAGRSRESRHRTARASAPRRERSQPATVVETPAVSPSSEPDAAVQPAPPAGVPLTAPAQTARVESASSAQPLASVPGIAPAAVATKTSALREVMQPRVPASQPQATCKRFVTAVGMMVDVPCGR
jgi:hypothetical protein